MKTKDIGDIIFTILVTPFAIISTIFVTFNYYMKTKYYMLIYALIIIGCFMDYKDRPPDPDIDKMDCGQICLKEIAHYNAEIYFFETKEKEVVTLTTEDFYKYKIGDTICFKNYFSYKKIYPELVIIVVTCIIAFLHLLIKTDF